LKKKKLTTIIFGIILVLSLIVSLPAFADYKKTYFTETLYLSTTLWHPDYGLKPVWAKLNQVDYAYYYSSKMSDYYRTREAFWDYYCYGPNFTWEVDISATYYNGSTKIGATIWSWPDELEPAYLPSGYTRVGGGNTDDRWFTLGLYRKVTTALLFSSEDTTPTMRTVITNMGLN